jgi:hypothetical protein
LLQPCSECYRADFTSSSTVSDGKCYFRIHVARGLHPSSELAVILSCSDGSNCPKTLEIRSAASESALSSSKPFLIGNPNQGFCGPEISNSAAFIHSITASSNDSRVQAELLSGAKYWQSDGETGKHWICIELKPGILVSEVGICIDGNDCNYCPDNLGISTAEQSGSFTAEITKHVKCSGKLYVPVLEGNVDPKVRFIKIRVISSDGGAQCKIRGVIVRPLASHQQEIQVQPLNLRSSGMSYVPILPPDFDPSHTVIEVKITAIDDGTGDFRIRGLVARAFVPIEPEYAMIIDRPVDEKVNIKPLNGASQKQVCAPVNMAFGRVVLVGWFCGICLICFCRWRCGI